MHSCSEVKNSFFLRFLLWTVFLGNFYVLFQSIFHSFNIHFLDLYFRWYAFNIPPAYNIFLVITSGITLIGAYIIYTKGRPGFRSYFLGKLANTLALLIVISKEYQYSQIDFPYILIPIVAGIEMIYPMIISISLRKALKKQLQ